MKLRVRFWLKRLESVLIVVIFVICVLSILSIHTETTTHWTKLHQHMLAKLPGYLPDPFRDTPFNRTGNISDTLIVPNNKLSPQYELDWSKENYREWFDNRSIVEPYVNKKQEHLVISDFIITNSKLCGGEVVDVLIYFHSTWSNVNKRRVLRETWASSKVFQNISIKTIFILGKSQKEEDQFKIDLENVVHGDIVQGDFIDSFQNLTLKSAIVIHWINTHCLQARYVIKADDDIFVNIFKVVEDLIPVLAQRNTTVMCHFHSAGASTIIRNNKSKWYIPPNVFKGEKYFPRFCSGYVTIFTSDLIPLLYRSSFRAPIIPVDDVYMFGLLPHADKFMEYIDIRQNLTLNKNIALKQYSGLEPLTYLGAIAWDANTMESYWALTLNRLTPWAKKRARITAMRDTMGPRSLI